MCSIENVKRQQATKDAYNTHACAKEATSRRTRRATGFSKHPAIRQSTHVVNSNPFVIPFFLNAVMRTSRYYYS